MALSKAFWARCSWTRIAFFSCTLSATGCDWRQLDEAVERAPVLSLEAPSGYRASDVGRLIVALPPPAERPEVAARFFIAGTTRSSAAVIELDAGGRATTHNVPASILAPMGGEPMTSVALSGPKPNQPYPSVLLGAANKKDANLFMTGAAWRLRIEPGPSFVLDPMLVPSAALPSPGGINGFGRGVAAGSVSGSAEVDDWVIVSNAGVTLLEDGVDTAVVLTPPQGCPVVSDRLSLERLYEHSRNPAIADFIPSLPGGEIAVGVPRNSGGGVVLLRREAQALGCPMVVAVAGLPSLGVAVAAGDINNDGAVDLAVGAPALPAPQVLVFFGPFDPATPLKPPLTIAAPAGAEASEFGARLALLNLDGAPGLELAVAAPRLASGGKSDAGTIFLYRPDGSQLPLVVADSDPEELSGLGEGLAVVPFRDAGCQTGVVKPLLVGGANKEVFSYFLLPQLTSDLRCLPSK